MVDGSGADGVVRVRPALPQEMETVWEAAYTHLDWTESNGPYFPFSVPTLDEYETDTFPVLVEGRMARVIDLDGRIVGQVSAHWECEATRWLEVGIVLFSSERWGRGVGRQALAQWTTCQFDQHELERIGLTTWSGNERMVRCALALGFTLEGRLRRCRYYKGVYYDSMKFGVLRDEWFAGGRRAPGRVASPPA